MYVKKAEANADGLKDKIVFINRCSKVVKGGKRFSFAAIVVVGDQKAQVGMGKGKAAEVPEAIRKAIENAKKNMILLPKMTTTIPFEVIGHYGAEDVLLKPASAGTGIVAGGAVRAVMEVAGITNILCKSLGSGNPCNLVRATLQGLSQLKERTEAIQMRHAPAVPLD
ncbi:MAG: 30S ribosomal protein S5 [Nitrospirota bacterium]